MKLYLLENENRYSQIVEACGTLERNAESEKVDQFISGSDAPILNEPLKVRIHYKAAKPKPLPDFCRGTYLFFVSSRGKSIIERFIGSFAQFVPVDVIGLGVDNGKSWSEADFNDSPFREIPPYYVLHIARTAEVLDINKSTIIRDSIGEMPQLLPFGQFHCLVFKRDIPIPPLFALPYHINLPLVSSTFVEAAKREKLHGFRPIEAFDTDADFLFDEAVPSDVSSLVSLKDAIEIVSRRDV